MEKNIKEIAYNLIQNEYFKRRNIDVKTLDLSQIIKMFPEDWFLKYGIDERIDIITLALKNNINLEEAIELKGKSK